MSSRLTYALFSFALLHTTSVTLSSEIDFNRDVRPIFAENCLACHGFDEESREAGLRLDTREGATANRDGRPAVIPGKPESSELLQRVASHDPDLLMPPPDSKRKALDTGSIEILRRWIEQGATWGRHWAFVPPQRPELAAPDQHPIDELVQRQLPPVGLTAAKRADEVTLARRMSFDLQGLPPDKQRIAELLNDDSADKWTAYLDELLNSPHYGERMAMWWLDGARYSDTDGYQQDATRSNWPWRDWVVQAFNQNKPFDEFTIEQFAGDLLEDPTPEQRLATCFHRNHMTNGEGGRDKEESRVDYVLDRVNTTGTLWLGLTVGCAQCHDHKFDPISQQDYYSLFAYFNSIDENGAAGSGAGPYLNYRSPAGGEAAQRASALLKESDAELQRVREQALAEFVTWLADRWEESQHGFQPWVFVQPQKLLTSEGTALSAEEESILRAAPSELPQDDYLIVTDLSGLSRLTGVRLEVFPDEAHTEGKYSYSPSGEFILTNVKLQILKEGDAQVREVELQGAIADVEGVGEDKTYGKVKDTLDDDPRRGWTTRTKPSDAKHTALFALREPLRLQADERLRVVLMQRSLAPRELIGRFRLSLTDQPGEAVRSLVPMPLEELANHRRTKPESDLNSIPSQLRTRLLNQFLADHKTWRSAQARHRSIQEQERSAQRAAQDQRVMVLSERKEPRTTHILVRGVWDQPGDEVRPAVPESILAPESEATTSRLDLARWLVAQENPLVARVIANHIWQLFFGAGLVRTPNDFGTQGEVPTHPELLDWLAVELLESGWDLKHLIRQIVTSHTYQQSSDVTATTREVDPENRWLARGARFRLPSWMIRDANLKVSGLLNESLGGPPVFPYQPEGVWRDQFMGRFTYKPTLGPEQYRRTLYAFWRRSSTPTFLFDAATRRTCEVITRRTNTPLHALTLMNDQTSWEAARNLADRAVTTDGDEQAKLRFLFQAVLTRSPEPDEVQVLQESHQQAVEHYRRLPDQARQFTTVGQRPLVAEEQLVATAAAMMIANLLLNLDESITHE